MTYINMAWTVRIIRIMDYSHICYRESSIYENEMMSFAETSLLVENGIHCCLRNPRVSPFREFRKKKKKTLLTRRYRWQKPQVRQQRESERETTDDGRDIVSVCFSNDGIDLKRVNEGRLHLGPVNLVIFTFSPYSLDYFNTNVVDYKLGGASPPLLNN
jgi:hypothetical protein